MTGGPFRTMLASGNVVAALGGVANCKGPRPQVSQSVQLEFHYETRTPKSYHVWFLNPNSLTALFWTLWDLSIAATKQLFGLQRTVDQVVVSKDISKATRSY